MGPCSSKIASAGARSYLRLANRGRGSTGRCRRLMLTVGTPQMNITAFQLSDRRLRAAPLFHCSKCLYLHEEIRARELLYGNCRALRRRRSEIALPEFGV